MYLCNGEYNCDVYPPIIDKAIYVKANRILELNRYGKSDLEPYHYKGKIFCKNCGSVYFADSGTSKGNKVHRYYKCSQRRKHHTCDSITYRKDILEDHLTSFIKSFILDETNIETVAMTLLNKNKHKKNINLVKSSEYEKQRCETSLDNLVKAVENGIYTETTTDRIKVLENRISELKAIIYLENNKDNIRYTKAHIRKFFQKSLTLSGINFAYYLVKEIFIDDQNIEIYLENPYNVEYKSFDLVEKQEYVKEYITKCKTEIIARNISIFI